VTCPRPAARRSRPSAKRSRASRWSAPIPILRFPHVEPNKTYTLTIAAALTAADGSKIGRDIEMKVFTGELEPAVGFASQGSVLPAKDSRGLPVVSVNVAEVDVEFLRVREASLPRFFAEYQRGGRRGSWELDPSWYDESDERQSPADLQAGRAGLQQPLRAERQGNERSLSYLPIQNIPELQKPGLYFAALKRPGTFRSEIETSFYFVSDIGVHSRIYKDKLFVHTASLKSGEPISGVELSVIDATGKPVANARADENGNAMLAYTLDAAHVLVAKSGRDVSMLPFNQPALDLSDFAVAGAARPGSTCSPGVAAICIAPAKQCACRHCCVTTTASRSRRSRCLPRSSNPMAVLMRKRALNPANSAISSGRA
jgi:uncharacterized protein YfaS (alpha-2-macroglobulin family)